MHKKLCIQACILFLLLIAAFWWGEAGGGIENIFRALLASLAFSSTALFLKIKWIYKLWIYLFSVVLMIAVFMFGQASMGKAFNNCVEHGEDVRVDLQKYFEAHHHYPNTLSELNNQTCNRILRPSILSYLPVNQGYQLYFGDSFVGFTANESQSFEAHK